MSKDESQATGEQRLQTLIGANGETERKAWALRAKQNGRKLVGILDYYVPEELVIAAGASPFRVTGTRNSDVSQAAYYRTMKTDLFCTHVLESVLAGELDYLDGIIWTDFDDDMRRLGDVFNHIQKPAFRPKVHVPHTDIDLGVSYYAEELQILANQLEVLTGITITQRSLLDAIAEVNLTRELLHRVNQLRKRDQPAVTGSEMLGLVTAAQVMPKAEFNNDLGELMSFVEQRVAPVKATHPRLLVASDRLDHPGYLRIVEDAGAVIASDDLDTGVRYYEGAVETGGSDLYRALSSRYLRKPASPGMWFWDRYLDDVVLRIKEFNVDGVINYSQRQSVDRPIRWPNLRDRLDKIGVPSISLINDYTYANEGPLRTRVEAFVEMLTTAY